MYTLAYLRLLTFTLELIHSKSVATMRKAKSTSEKCNFIMSERNQTILFFNK